jgi:hypothetical protein
LVGCTSPSCAVALLRPTIASSPPPYPLPRTPQVPPTTFSRPESKTEPRRLSFWQGAPFLPLPLDRPIAGLSRFNPSPPRSSKVLASPSNCLQPPPVKNRAPAARFWAGVDSPLPLPLAPSQSTITSAPPLPHFVWTPSSPPITFGHPQPKIEPQQLVFARGSTTPPPLAKIHITTPLSPRFAPQHAKPSPCGLVWVFIIFLYIV